MSDEEQREILTKMFGADPGPKYGDNTGYEEFQRKFDELWEEEEDHGDL